MPPQTFDSDSESEPVNRKAPADDIEMEEDVEEEAEGDEEEAGEDEYVVEAIKDHKFEGKVSYKTYVKSRTHHHFSILHPIVPRVTSGEPCCPPNPLPYCW